MGVALPRDRLDRLQILGLGVRNDPLDNVARTNLAETYEVGPTECQELPTGNYDVSVLAGIAGGAASRVGASSSHQSATEPCSLIAKS